MNTSKYTADRLRGRLFCTTRILGEAQAQTAKAGNEPAPPAVAKDNGAERGFARTEKASQAAQVNLSARLSKEGATQSQTAGFWEVWRLLKIARPEAKVLGGAAANYGRIIILRIVGERIVARLRSQLFRNTFVQNAEFFDANRVGDLISRLSSDTIIVGKSITQNLSDGLRAFVSGGAGFGLMAYVSLKLTGILTLMFPPVAIGAFFYGRAIRNLSRKIQKSLGSLTKIAEERLGNVRTSQAFAGEILEVSRYNKQVRRIFDLGKREALISATFFSTTGLMGNMTILALLYVGGSMVKSGAISIGDLTSFLMYTAYAGSSLFGLSSFYSELMKGVGAASRLFELQDRKPTIPATVGTKVEHARGPIRFENVTFSYPTRPAVTIFNNLDFEIPQGTNIAVVGPSGGGKSTIAALMLRFYSPTKGKIKINGKDISEMNGKSLRRKIGLVAQEPVLFSGSIADNIAYAKPGATRGEIIAAAKKANCSFISDFPDGLDTSVGARGAQLSGGQKQRIAIARALVKDPDILILDEATSALDAESETLVNSALAALLKGNNTTISIAHRLSTIKRSDRIIVLSSDGKVAEQGSYKELSNNPNGAFTKLMEWQMSGGDAAEPPSAAPESERRGPPTEAEEFQQALDEDEVGEENIEEEGVKVRRGNESKSEAVLEKAGKQDQ
ncbi:MAG: ATP-binding cassette permease mdl1 [Candelina mexicana]|nr:MAG: ATP-binding cassette permease mdl1 [Candelina mexicana]